MEFKDIRDAKATSPIVGMNKDVDPMYLEKGLYTHALNAQLSSFDGNAPVIQNEPSNFKCTNFPLNKQIIGSIAISGRRHVVFFTDNIDSEIGVFDEKVCTYTKVVGATCLNFKTTNLVYGISKENSDCSESIYWTDDLNPRRHLNLSKVPYKYTLKKNPATGLFERVFTTELDCEQLLVDKKNSYPRIITTIGGDGNLRNGAYQVSIAYSINQQRVSDYYSTTFPEKVWSHEDIGRSLNVEIENLDRDYPEYIVALTSTVHQQTATNIIGYYSTAQNKLIVSSVKGEEISNLELIAKRPSYETAKYVTSSNGYALWTEPSSRKELDYQKDALKIIPKWVAYKVPADYYRKGGNKVGYERDEVYAWGIQWIFDTGELSPVYHIPGPEAKDSDLQRVAGPDVYEYDVDCDPPEHVRRFEAFNTATGSLILTPPSKCDELVIGEGEMGYYESTEKYPDNKFLYGDQVGKPIRHPKFPDSSLIPLHQDEGKSVIIMGIKFENIKMPSNPKGIVGFRIVRGNRQNDKSVLAKGFIFNTREYEFTAGGQITKALFPNYPYNDLRSDPFLSKKLPHINSSNKEKDFQPLTGYRKDIFTFHSPSTSFGARIRLGSEIKIENEQVATVKGKFEPVYGHPRHKLLRNFAVLIAAGVGVGEGLLSIKGKTMYEVQAPSVDKVALTHVGVTTKTNSDPTVILPFSTIAQSAIDASFQAPATAAVAALLYQKYKKTKSLDKIVYGNGTEYGVKRVHEETAYDNIPILNIVGKILSFSYFFFQGIDVALKVIRAFVPFEKYAYQYNSHGFFNTTLPAQANNTRRRVENYNYLYPVAQDFEGIRVNNFKRESSVVLRTNAVINDPITVDNSRQTISTAGICKTKDAEITTTASAYYVSIKQKRPDQYGQVDSVEYLDTGYVQFIDGSSKLTTEPVFGGDTYITRFTQKRKMHFFNQTEFNELDGHEFDYSKYINVQYPRFWMNTQEYDPADLISLKLPNHRHNLDCNTGGFFAAIKNIDSSFVYRDAVMYLFVNGVIDFFCESPYNLDYRDWEENPQFRHYDRDTYTDLSQLFRHDYMDFDNRYLYDLSLTKGLTENQIQVQSLDFDPNSNCLTKYPGRVIYSLPSSREQKADNWLTYLALNYHDFPKEYGSISSIQPLGRFDILFLFNEGPPCLHRTIDELKTDSGQKITVGDGGLFSREPQPISNTDYDFGNCQSSHALSNTHYGVFYPSQRQGKVFLYGQKLQDISSGMESWFKEYLPSKLLEKFPDFKHPDNPIDGVGLLSVFNPQRDIYYLTKVDYKPIEGVIYDASKNEFSFSGTRVSFRNPLFFEDASWTLSYSPRTNTWVSFHSWIPDWTIQTELNPITCKQGFWRHNELCTHYCNFYGNQDMYEIEFVVSNGLSNEILGNIEYSLEAFKFFNCSDKKRLVDYTFNEATVHNDEQISGLLKFNLNKKMTDAITYPIIHNSSIDVLHSRAEHSFRFQQFWDITKNITKDEPMWITSPNGYKRTVNKRYVDYLKRQSERKAFRNTYNKVLLRRIEKEPEQMPLMLFKFNISKQIKSPR